MQQPQSQTNSQFQIQVVQTPTVIGKGSVDDEQTPAVLPNSDSSAINLKETERESEYTRSDSTVTAFGLSPSMRSFHNRKSKRGSQIGQPESPFRRQMKSLIQQSLKKEKKTKYQFLSSKLQFKNKKSQQYLKGVDGVVKEDLNEDEQDDRRLDLFEEMQTIEREFGSVYNDDQEHLFEVKPPTSLWYLVYDSLQRRPKFDRLMESIEQAKIDADSNEEVKKKKLLEDYFKMKMLKNVPQTKVKTKEQELDEFIKTSNNPSKTLQEVKKMIEAEEKSHRGAKIKDVKRIMEVIDDQFQQDETRLNYFKKFTKYRYPGVKYKGEQVQSKVNHRWSMQQWNNILKDRDQQKNLPKSPRRTSPSLKINTNFMHSQVLSSGSTEGSRSPNMKAKFVQGGDISNLTKSNSPINKRNTEPFQSDFKFQTVRQTKHSQAVSRARKIDSLDLMGNKTSQDFGSVANRQYFQQRTSSRLQSGDHSPDHTPKSQTPSEFVNSMAEFAFQRIKETIASLDSYIYRRQQDNEQRKKNKSQLSQNRIAKSQATHREQIYDAEVQVEPAQDIEDPKKFKKSELNKCLSQRIVLVNLAAAVQARNLVLLDFAWVPAFADKSFYFEFRTDIIPIIQLLKKFFATKEEDASYRKVLIRKLQQINIRIMRTRQTVNSLPSARGGDQLFSPESKDLQQRSQYNSRSTSNASRGHSQTKQYVNDKVNNRIAYRKLRKPARDENKTVLPNLDKPARKFASRQRTGNKTVKNITSPHFSMNYSKSIFREHLQKSKLAHLQNCQQSADMTVKTARNKMIDDPESPLLPVTVSNEYKVTTSATYFASPRGVQSAKNEEIYVPGQQSIELLTQRRKSVFKMISTPMQPVYMTGHSRPVRQVLHNYDGDLLFTCSDDGKVCMYNTFKCERVGLFDLGEACRSIDVTTNSKHLLAAATTFGFYIFDVETGKTIAKVKVPGLQTKQVGIAFGDKQFFVMYDHNRTSYIRVMDLQQIINNAEAGKDEEPKVIQEITGPRDYTFNFAQWGPLNKTIFVATTTGRLMQYDISSGKVLQDEQVHKSEIFQIHLTHDYTMLTTCSRDGTAKVLNRKDFKAVRTFTYGKPCRSAAVSPLFDDPEIQKFHLIMAGGQEARDVTTTGADEGGFEMKMYSVIFEDKLAEIHGHFGPVHSVNFSPDGMAFATGAEDGYVHYHHFPPEYYTKKFE